MVVPWQRWRRGSTWPPADDRCSEPSLALNTEDLHQPHALPTVPQKQRSQKPPFPNLRPNLPSSLHLPPHRVSAVRDREAKAVVGLTYRVGLHTPGLAATLSDVLHYMVGAG